MNDHNGWTPSLEDSAIFGHTRHPLLVKVKNGNPGDTSHTKNYLIIVWIMVIPANSHVYIALYVAVHYLNLTSPAGPTVFDEPPWPIL